MRLRAAAGLGLAAVLALSACTDAGGGDPPAGGVESPDPTKQATIEPASVALPAEPTAVLSGSTADALAIEASQTLFTQSPAAVLVAVGEDQTGAAAIAVDLGIPLLLAPAATTPTTSASAATSSPAPTSSPVAAGEQTVDELVRLQVVTIIAVGAGASAFADGLPGEIEVVAAPADADGANDLPEGSLQDLAPPAPPAAFAALTVAGTDTVAASATVEAAGGIVHELTVSDPRTDSDLIAALATEKPAFVVGLGSGFGSPEQLAYRVGVAETGVELPGGGQVLYPYRRNIALYGNPTTAGLGSLGEQGLAESITRVTDLAKQYQAFTDAICVPTFELIATVASSSPSSGGDYSTEMTADVIRPYVDAAREAGVYVVLDLQPGRADFLTQAKLYEEFLKEPNVGLALDPEWRLKPNQVHLEQVGTVTAAEINSVVTWLADLTRDNNLPQKILMLHQFRTEMISDRGTVDTSRDELAVVIHVDGFGPTGSKFATWNRMRADPPPNVWWGWKNFIDEDSPTLTPEQTMKVEPVPQFVSYQ
jgi:hypothetical protein